MNSLDLNPVLEDISFVQRYQKLCEDYNNFENRMKGLHTELYERVLKACNVNYIYFKRERFFKVVESYNDYIFTLQLILKDGIIEPSINIKYKGIYYFPNGRFDFIPQKMGLAFDRKKYNLPKYSNEGELSQIIGEISLIFKDIIRVLINRNNNIYLH